MGRAIVGPDIGLDLDDPPDATGIADQAGAEEPAGCLEGRSGEELPGPGRRRFGPAD